MFSPELSSRCINASEAAKLSSVCHNRHHQPQEAAELLKSLSYCSYVSRKHVYLTTKAPTEPILKQKQFDNLFTDDVRGKCRTVMLLADCAHVHTG